MSMGRYLITGDNFTPFFSDYFNYENHYNSELNMIVYDLQKNIYSIDGVHWLNIESDHL